MGAWRNDRLESISQIVYVGSNWGIHDFSSKLQKYVCRSGNGMKRLTSIFLFFNRVFEKSWNVELK